MVNNRRTFKTAALEDGTTVVVCADPKRPHILEVIAAFHDAKRAQKYADTENAQSAIQPETAPVATPHTEPAKATIDSGAQEEHGAQEPGEAADGLTGRQSAVLEALRAKANDENLVEIRAALLAETAKIPLGTLHSVLRSLEKKQRILTKRLGTAHAPAIYQVL